MEIAVTNIFRYKIKSIIIILLDFLLILMTNIYLNNIDTNVQQLRQLKDAVPVYCRVTNLNGTKESGLYIKPEVLKGLKECRHIKKLVYGGSMLGGIGEFSPEDWARHLNLNIMSSNAAEGIVGNQTDQIHLTKEEQKAFFESEKAECLVNHSVMEKEGWKIGDTIDLNMYYYVNDNFKGLMIYPLSIVPVTIKGEMAEDAAAAAGAPLDIVLPIGFVEQEYARNQIDYMAESASFYVSDPLKLNEFKEEMRSIPLLSQSPDALANDEGCALSVRDETFITLATNLQQTISMLKVCFIPICIGLMVIGYFVSLILMNGRQEEFLLMRTLGMKARQCVGIYVAEQVLLTLTGTGIGILICLCGAKTETVIGTAAAVSCFYLSGTCVALWRFARVKIIQLLHVKE